MNNQGVVNADRISQLPEALIQEILCLLPTKLAITTSVLSKQWQSHWKMMPNLKFDSYSHEFETGPFWTFLLSDKAHELEIENFCKYLLSNKAPVLQSLHLRVRLGACNINAVDIGILIGIAFTRNVRELELDVDCDKGSFTIPRSLYNCKILETLKFGLDVVMDVPSSVYLKSLRTLHLYSVDFRDEESFVNLLSGCPNLENFVVRRNAHSSVKTFTIAVPSLRRLSIHNGYVGENWGYVINAPSLKFLKISGFRAVNHSCVTENLPELVEASIRDVSGTLFNEKLLVSLTSVKRLSLDISPLKFKFPIGSIFHQLVYLELYTYYDEWWNLLTFMLDSSPKLQVLKLIDHLFSWNFVASTGEWNQPNNVPECLSFHLEIFTWEAYKWKVEDEREVAKYILKNTNHLKRATFSSFHISPEERIEVEKALKSIVRATNSCQFQFK